MPPRVLPSQVVALIDSSFPNARPQQEDPTNQSRQWEIGLGATTTLAALVDLVEEIPRELLVLESERYVELLTALEVIRTAIRTMQSRGDVHPLRKISGFSDLNPVTLIRRALASCPDQMPSPATVELAFIPDQQLRDDLRLDISAATRAFADGEWKTATVLAGSVVEALLLWKLSQRLEAVLQAKNQLVVAGLLPRDPGNNPESWSLHPLIEVAARLDAIRPHSAAQARLAKDFRDLIHPGREIRLGQKCDRGTALSALAAVEHVVRDLGRQ
jgi:hypothetical protein